MHGYPDLSNQTSLRSYFGFDSSGAVPRPSPLSAEKAEQISLRYRKEVMSMQFHISTHENNVTVHADVVKIEVEDIIGPDEDDIDDTCYRTIRFINADGEAIEVFCDAPDEKPLTLHRIRPRKAVKRVKEEDWLEPTVYTGSLDDEDE
jgi:hypothetical protein